MTDAAYTLEALTTSSSGETERFYRISSAGLPVLRSLAASLAWVAGEEGQMTIAPRPVGVDVVLREADKYLANCSTVLSERDKWLRG